MFIPRLTGRIGGRAQAGVGGDILGIPESTDVGQLDEDAGDRARADTWERAEQGVLPGQLRGAGGFCLDGLVDFVQLGAALGDHLLQNAPAGLACTPHWPGAGCGRR